MDLAVRIAAGMNRSMAQFGTLLKISNILAKERGIY